MRSLAGSSVLRDGLLVPVQDSSLPLLSFPVIATLRVCLPRTPALLQMLEAMLAEGALKSPSILVLSFHSSFSLVEVSSDGLAASVRYLSPGRLCLTRLCLTHSVRIEFHRFCAISLLRLAFLALLGLTVDFLSDLVALFLEETIEIPMWVGFFSSLSGSSTVDFFPVFPRVFSPGVVMGFDFAGVVVWLLLAPRSLTPPSRSTPFVRFVTFWHLGDVSWGPPLFLHSLRRFLASCLMALPFASLPLVSRPWTVLSWSPLLSLSSVSDCLVVVPCQLVGLGRCSPASPNCPPPRVRKQRSSSSLLRYRFESLL